MTLYLKYRPKDFESLVWQSFIKNTLREAIKQDKLVWAYLFCWPRWTGKTSTARIFAKSINCLNPKDWNPCLNCEICKWFADDSLVDIIEIDAASYTWVDNVREIIERAKFLPTKTKYKVYIIDEVHMLSKWAFNALLKILEEPPSHLKFILATTEIHKIPETILSRCQRYDFKSITNEDVKNQLLYIAKNENVKIDEKSLDFIVKQASWWLRNAISLFEQLIKNDEIKFENVISDYWIPENEKVVNFYEKLLNRDNSIIKDFDEISLNFNLNLFFKEILFLLKDKLIENLNWENFKNILYLLETLEDSFLKAKNSFDWKTTFLVWILKCLKWNEFFKEDIKNTPIQKKIESPNKLNSSNQILEAQIEVKKTENIEENDFENELSDDDLLDVFWNQEIEYIPSKKEVEKEKIIEASKNHSFPKDEFINNLKEIKAKWALTMSLRSSDFYLTPEKLNIKAKTKISFNQINEPESIAKMNEVLKKMWFEKIELTIS